MPIHYLGAHPIPKTHCPDRVTSAPAPVDKHLLDSHKMEEANDERTKPVRVESFRRTPRGLHTQDAVHEQFSTPSTHKTKRSPNSCTQRLHVDATHPSASSQIVRIPRRVLSTSVQRQHQAPKHHQGVTHSHPHGIASKAHTRHPRTMPPARPSHWRPPVRQAS